MIPCKLEDVSGKAVFLKSYPRSPFWGNMDFWKNLGTNRDQKIEIGPYKDLP